MGKRAAPSAQLLEARLVRRPEQSEVFLGSMIALASANTSSVSISLHIATAKNSVSVQYCPNVPSLTTMSLRSITHPALYGWLEPTYGVFPALSIVGGVLAVLALVLIKAADDSKQRKAR